MKMNQDLDGHSGESNECGDPFSYRREKMLNEIKIEFEDESDVLDDSIVHNCNANCITDFSDESKECGNPFSISQVEILDKIQVKFEDESVNCDSTSQVNENVDGIVDILGNNEECGEHFTKDCNNDDNTIIDHIKIKVEDDIDYFDVPSSSNDHVTAYIDKICSTKRTSTSEGSISKYINQAQTRLEELSGPFDNGKEDGQEESKVPLKRYKCNICGIRFLYPSALKIHIRIHTREQPSHSEVCGKSFTGKGNLKRHRQTHNDKTAIKSAKYVEKNSNGIIALKATSEFILVKNLSNVKFVVKDFYDKNILKLI